MNINEYKEKFTEIYNQMISEFGVEKASVSISWIVVINYGKDGEKSYKPNAVISF